MSDPTLVRQAMLTLIREIAFGTGPDAAWVLNPGDRGLLASLDRLSASEANASTAGGAPIAAHADHLRYGLTLLNRWGAGEDDPFSTADYSASWQRPPVTDEEWKALRASLSGELRALSGVIEGRREWDEVSLTGVMAGVVHLAYHLGAIRQIAGAARGPRAKEH
jgi:hypothetical protein